MFPLQVWILLRGMEFNFCGRKGAKIPRNARRCRFSANLLKSGFVIMLPFRVDRILRGCVAFRHGTDVEPKPLDDSAVWSAARGHCTRSIVFRGLVAETLSDSCRVAWSDHSGLLPD